MTISDLQNLLAKFPQDTQISVVTTSRSETNTIRVRGLTLDISKPRPGLPRLDLHVGADK